MHLRLSNVTLLRMEFNVTLTTTLVQLNLLIPLMPLVLVITAPNQGWTLTRFNKGIKSSHTKLPLIVYKG
jgi:hypothetical protein